MQAEIITIGDEILIGQIIDSNSAWMAQELNRIGVRVKLSKHFPMPSKGQISF
jgi:nicotinamide-nucleotide amidase